MKKTMYERIKDMSEEEMKGFIYMVYLAGNNDGKNNMCDSPSGYFGGVMLNMDASEVMKNDDVNSLWDKWNLGC